MYWLSFILSTFLYHFSLIKLILLIGKPISASPSVYITSPDGLQRTEPNLWMVGYTSLDFQRISQGPFIIGIKTLLETSHPSTFFSGNKKQMELGNYKNLRNYYIHGIYKIFIKASLSDLDLNPYLLDSHDMSTSCSKCNLRLCWPKRFALNFC